MNIQLASVAALAAAFALHADAGDVVVENAAFRLSLGEDGYARSLVVKSTGEECLAPGVRVPFARLRQDRPYDNELHLTLPARPTFFPSDRISRKGDVLEIGFANEYHVMKVRLTASDDYVAFVPEGTDYVITDDFGDKRRTEIDGVEFLRLPVKDRERFGECANVAWDDRVAVSVMGLSPEVRIDGAAAEGAAGWRLMRAGTENAVGLFGHGAAIVAGSKGRWLDHVDALERDFGLPRGVRNRRDPVAHASHCLIGLSDGEDLTPENIGEYIKWIKKGGFRVCMVYYTAFAQTCGHFTWRKTYPNGIKDLKRVADSLRAAGITPALHIHYSKVSVDDPYAADTRIACAKEVCLASDVGPDDGELLLQGSSDGLRTEEGRRLVRFGRELVSYEGFTKGRPCKLLGVKRGLCGTPRLAHSSGEYGRHLDVDDWFYFHRVDQATGLQDEIAQRLAEIVDTCGFSVIYLDGAEDVPPPYWYNVPLAQKRVLSRIKTDLRGAGSAMKSHFGWHMSSRGNGFDTFYPERTRQALDKFILPAARLAADDFSVVDFGLLEFYLPGTRTKPKATYLADNSFADVTAGTTPEQVEMLLRAAYENGAPVSFKLSPKKLKAHPQAEEILAVFKKYEDMKFSGDVTLARRGAPPEYAIVTRKDATGVEKYAASELRDFIKRQTGVELEIRDDSAPVPEKAILVMTDTGDASLGDEGFSISVEGERLRILGGCERGALYGVYEVLERFGGCAWYSSWNEVVPRLDAFKVPRGFSDRQIPAFSLRTHSWLDMMNNSALAERNRMNRPKGNTAKFGRSRWVFDRVLGKCHTFAYLMPTEKWFDAHPEYFSEVNGKRVRQNPQLCLTNPDVVRICTEEVLKRVKESYPKGIRLYGVSQNDWSNFCTCEKCRALDEAEGSHSATLVQFVNAIAEAVTRQYPDVLIETLVYRYTRKPPKTLRFHKSVRPCLCTIECDFHEPIEGGAFEENKAVCETIRQWGERSSGMMVWDYTTDFRNYLYTWPNVKSLGPNLRFFRKHGVAALYEQGCSKGLHADWGELKAWLLAKLMWNPDLDVSALLDRYFRDSFGPAAPEVRRYFEEVHAVPRDTAANPMGCYEPVTSPNMPNDFLERAAKLLNAAAKKLEGDENAAYARNLLYTRLSLDYTRAARTCAKRFLRKDLDGFDVARYRDALDGAKRIAAVDAKTPVAFAEGSGYNSAYRKEIVDCIKRPVPTSGCTRLVLEESCMGIGGGTNRCMYVDDPDAEDGRALWLSNTHYGWTGYFHVDSIDFKPGSTLRLRVRAKVRKNPKYQKGEAFWTGVYSIPKKKDCTKTLAPRVENVEDGVYAWYDLGEWKPEGGEELWVAPGRFTDGHSCHGGVWIDKYEVTLQ